MLVFCYKMCGMYLIVALESSDLMQPELIGLQPELVLGDFESSEPLQGESSLTEFIFYKLGL